MPTFSLLSLIFSVLFSLFLFSFSYALSSLHCGGCGFFFFCCDRFLKEEVGMAGLWVMFGSLVVVGSGVWIVAEVGCWSSEIASVWVRRGHGEIDVSHDDGFGGYWRRSWHGWLVLLGFRWVFIFIFILLIWVFVPVEFW